jgi:hypothetical protein
MISKTALSYGQARSHKWEMHCEALGGEFVVQFSWTEFDYCMGAIESRKSRCALNSISYAKPLPTRLSFLFINMKCAVPSFQCFILSCCSESFPIPLLDSPNDHLFTLVA